MVVNAVSEATTMGLTRLIGWNRQAGDDRRNR